jgi:rhodanese-related sulfurtransferase
VSIIRLGLILLVSLVLAAYAEWLRAARPDKDGGVPMVGGIRLYRFEEVRQLYRRKATCLLDVRPALVYMDGHIPGAVNLPEGDFDKLFLSLRKRLERAQTIIVYCDSARCARALRVVIRLRELGLEQAQVYAGGWNEWLYYRMPSERSPAS